MASKSNSELFAETLFNTFGRMDDSLAEMVERAEQNGAVGPCTNLLACMDVDNRQECRRQGHYRANWKAIVCDSCYSRYSPCLGEDA